MPAHPSGRAVEIRDAYAGLGRPKVAVRSSSVNEDLPGASFAGQYASFLNVGDEDALMVAVGLLVQFEWHGQADGGEAVVRELHVLRLDAGRIAEQVMFCAGIWSPQLQAQLAGEAPLIRP